MKTQHARRAGIAFVWLAAQPVAFAQQGATVHLEYRVVDDQGCRDEQSFRYEVAAKLGYEPFREDSPTSLVARVERRGNAFVGRVRVVNTQGEVTGVRDFDDPEPQCDELVAAMAIAVAIFLDPIGADVQSERGSGAAAPVHRVEPPSQTRVPLRQRTKIRGLIDGAITTAYGVTPGITLGPRLGIGARFNSVSLQIEASVDLMPTDARAGMGDRIEAAIYSAGPVGCVPIGRGLLCLAVPIGAFQGRGVDVVDPRAQTGFFAEVDVRGGVEIPFGGGISLRALAEMRIPLVRTSLLIDDMTVWTGSPLAGGISLGFGATFL